MFELKYDKDKCLNCPDYYCFTKCLYMELDRYDARIEIRKIIDGQDSSVLLDCVLCYGCEEYCKKGNHLMFLISERPQLAARIKNKNLEDMAAAGTEVCALSAD